MKRQVCPKAPTLPERLIRLVYPVKCMICDSILREDSALYLCDACHKHLPRYGKGFRKIPQIPYIDSLFAAFYYDEGMDKAIQSMKFRHQPKLSATMAFLLQEELMNVSSIPDIDIIIPVPMHPRKKRQRGYNQAELVAEELSYYLGVPMRTDILIKTRYTPPQSLLKREERLHNMDDAFKAAKSDEVFGRNILLIDDVATTGTTINKCAKILYENDACRIYAAVIAIAEK